MPTPAQIERFRQRAKAAGYSDAQIAQEISRKQLEEAPKTTQNPQPNNQPVSTQPTNLRSQVGSGIVKVGKALVDPFIKGGKAAIEYVTNPDEYGPLAVGKKMAKGEKGVLKKDLSKLTDATLRPAAAAASWTVPFGKGANIVSKAIVPGAITGGLQTVGEQGTNITDVAGGAALGAGAGVALHGAGKVLEGAGKVFGKGKDWIANKASQRITKSTPSAWDKAVTEHGVDLNALAKKYIPAGVGYDDILGDISKRGNGGILGDALTAAEKKIQGAAKSAGTNIRVSGDEIIKSLKQELKIVENQIGEENKAKALKEIISQVEKKYKNGVSVNQALKTLRYANNKFGRSILETEGSAVATSAQKIEANSLRETLKKMFPDEIKNALDTQSEILTLRPSLNRARATASTPGSNIRVGGPDLTKPGTWLDPFFENDKVNSTLMQMGKNGEQVANKVPQMVNQATGQISSRVAANGLNNDNSQPVQDVQDTTSQDNAPSDPKHNDTSIAPQSHPLFGDISKQDILLQAFKNGASETQLDQIEKVYDKFAPQQAGVIDEGTQKAASSLRTEYLGQTKQNGYMDIVNSYRKVAGSTPTPAGDLSLIFAYMKMLDPGSTVREGEYATAEQTAGVPERIRAQYNKILKGDKLSEKQRFDFKKEAKRILDDSTKVQRQIDNIYVDLAKRYGVDPSLLGIGAIDIKE